MNLKTLLIVMIMFLSIISAELVTASSSVILRGDSIADTYVSSFTGNENKNYANDTSINTIQSTSSPIARGYFQLNITNITSQLYNVTEAYFYLTPYVVDATYNDILHEVYVNQSWTESGITWNNQPCGTSAAVSAAACNSSNTTYVTISSVNTTYKWNITNIIKRNKPTDQKTLLSWLIKYAETGTSSGQGHQFRSYDSTDTILYRPFVNITILESYFAEYGIDNCSLYPTNSYNFFIYDEKNFSSISADISGSLYWEKNSSINDFYNLNNTDSQSFSICISPSDASFTGNYTLSLSGTNYQPRHYTQNSAVYDNSINTVNLYLLSDADGIYSTFRIVDIYQNPLQGATMSISLNIGGSEYVIDTQVSDSSGIVTFWVNPDTTYSYSVTKSGYTATSGSIRPTSADIYTITLATSSTNTLPRFTGINYFFTPQYKNLNPNTFYNFTFNMSSSYWNITNCILYIQNESQNLIFNSTTFDTNSCNISINYNTGTQDLLQLKAFYLVNGSNVSETTQYSISENYNGNFTLLTMINKVKNYSSAGFGDKTRLFIGLIIVLFAVGFTAFKGEEREVEPLVFVALVAIWGVSWIGFFYLDIISIPTIAGLPVGWLNKYIIAILMTIFGAGIIFNRRQS